MIATPARYDAVVHHARRAPVRHRFRHRTSYWLVDVADLPWPRGPLRRIARFDLRDHLDIHAVLADRGIAANRLVMLSAPRSWGHAFNPISIFWCYDDGDALVAVVAEVHNTYGDAHAYLLPIGDDGRAEVDKRLYVSPFYPVDGRYRISVSTPGDRIAVTVTLQRDGDEPFTAGLYGRRRAASRAALLRSALRYPSWRVSGLIRWHGIRLWLRGLPVQPRPSGAAQRQLAAERR